MIGKRIEGILFIVIVALFLFFAAGCVDKVTQAAIDQVRNQAAIDAAKNKAAAAEAAAKAKAAADAAIEAAKSNPLLHPIAFANLIVSEIRPWLVSIGLFCTIFTFVGVGVIVAAKSVAFLGGIVGTLAKAITAVLFTTGLGCWVTLWIAPLFFLFMAVVFIGGVVWLIVYLRKHDWKISTLFDLHLQNENAIKQATGVDPKLLAAGITDVKSPSVVGAP